MNSKLARRIAFTLGALLLFRIGTYIPVPVIRRPITGHMFSRGISEIVRACGGVPGNRLLFFEQHEAHARVADRLMFDAADGILPGGNAKAFDWTVLSGHTVPVPWLLAGGLTPDNIAEAIRIAQPYAVDVSSGVEIPGRPGVKDHGKIRAFIQAARGA